MPCSRVGKNAIVRNDADDTPVENVAGPVEATIDVRAFKNFAVQIAYASATAGAFEVKARLDDELPFIADPEATTAVDPAGGNIFLNFTDRHWVDLQVCVPAGTTGVTVRFVGMVDEND